MDPHLALSVSPYPNSALSAGKLTVMAVVVVLSLAVWLVLVYVAARQPRHRDAAGMTSLPEQPRAQDRKRELPDRKAA
jgi:predicted metal-binding membrane protein